MVSSTAATPQEYLLQLAEDRRSVISAMRNFILEHLPDGYQETVNWGMLSYEVPLTTFPNTYNGQPLSYVGLAAQKHKNSLYLMGIYSDPETYQSLLQAFEKAGLKPDLGKSCIRFKQLEELPLEEIGRLIASVSPSQYIQSYQKSRIIER